MNEPGESELIKANLAKEKELAKQGMSTPESRVANFILSVRGKGIGTLLDTQLPLLGDLNDSRIIYPLIRALDDPESIVRALAVFALGKTRNPRAFRPLLAMLERRKTLDYASVLAAEALGHFNDLRAVDPLIDAAKDKNYKMRAQATLSLGRLKAEKAESLIRQNLEDPRPFVRLNAAFALEAMQIPDLAQCILWALKKEKDFTNQFSFINILGNAKDPVAIQPLLEILATSPNRNARINAIAAFGQIDDPSAVDPLETAMEQEKDPELKDLIANAIRFLKRNRENEVVIHSEPKVLYLK